ncbi:MAG TPA: hypothetical protein VFS33_08855 [Gemmatimonadales bacterium]|nr:hypothetical protein [Gemmatimonadales bacterium]
MPANTDSPGVRLWSNAVLIVVAVVLFAVGAWPDPLAVNPPARNSTSSWSVYVLAGALAFVALLAAQSWRWRGVARVLTLGASAVLAYGALTFRTSGGWWLWATTVLPALALLVTVPFIGPMPRGTAYTRRNH